MPARKARIDAPLVATNAVLSGAAPWALPLALRAVLMQPDGWRHLPQRFGFLPRISAPQRGRIWLHAAGPGEVTGAAPVIRALLARRPGADLVVSSYEEPGLRMAQRLFPDARARFFLPFDFLPLVRLAVARVRPTLCVLMETELWPNFLWTLARRGVPVAVINGQISDTAFRRARRFRGFYRWMLGHLAITCAQSAEEAERFCALGQPADRLLTVGSVKFDGLQQPNETVRERLREDLQLRADEPLLVAGSTHAGEEVLVLAAFTVLRRRIPGLRVLIAPRDRTRAGDVAALTARASYSVCRRSAPQPGVAVVVLDTMGELASAFGLGAVGFVGGSLVPVGGHNLLEPLAWGRPVVFGPHVQSFKEIADAVLAAGLGRQVSSAPALTKALAAYFESPELLSEVAARAPEFLRRHAGATERTVAALLPLLANGVVAR